MTDELELQSEVWTSTLADWGFMVAHRARLARHNFEALEWRIPPGDLAQIMADGAPDGLSMGWDHPTREGVWRVFGAPLILDLTLEEGTARALIDRTPSTVRQP